MANHLIIGLGGTGGSIVREVRKRIFQEYGKNEPDGNITVDYIYLDSDPKDLNDTDHKWTYLGTSVALPPANLINIHGMGSGVLSNLNAFPGLKAFISPEDAELLRDRQVSDIIGTGIGGQRRRFGRMLFANNLANSSANNQFSRVFIDKIHDLQRQGENDVTIHICAGLAGGTGSGTLIDILTQIHRKSEGQAASNFKIFLYLYVPEVIVAGKKDAGFYRANGYAALMELNAMSVGKYRPLDVSPNNLDYMGQPWRLPAGIGEPFNKAYLFTTVNAAGRVLPSGNQLSAAVGDFIFQKVLGTSSAMGRIMDSENNGCQPDTNEDGLPIHSRNFTTFGIKRVVYPESEIRGYINYSTIMSVIKQLVYNNWVDRAGFQVLSDDGAAGLGLDSEIKTPKGRQSFQISNEHLTLQSDIKGYENTGDWSSFQAYWERISAFLAKKTLEGSDDGHTWKGSYLNAMNLTYASNFREKGVKGFFEMQSRPENIKRFAKVLANNIETTLFNEWLTGLHGDHKPQSLQKIRMMLEIIHNDCLERIAEFNRLIDGTKRTLTQQIQPAVKNAESVLDHTNWLSHALFDSRKKNFNEFVTVKVKEFVAQTNLVAYEFALKLLPDLAHQIAEKINGLDHLINLFRLAETKLEGASTFIITKSAENGNEVSLVERVFDTSMMVQDNEDYILKDKELQDKIGNAIRASIRDKADSTGKGHSFGALYTALGGISTNAAIPDDDKENTDSVITFIQETTFPKVSEKLQQIADEEPDNQFLGVNVLQKIRQEYPDDTALRQYLTGLVASASPFALMSNDAGAMQGNNGSQSYDQFIQLCLPEYEDTEYRQKFIDIFASVARWNEEDKQRNVAVNSHPNELSIISVTADIPVRMLANVKTLRQKYLELVSGAASNNSDLNRMLLHTESMPSGVMPDLFAEDPSLRQRRFRVYTMILHSDPDALKKRQNLNHDGLEENAIIMGSGLRRTTLFVGKDMEETARMMEDGTGQQFRAAVIKYVDDVVLPKYVQNSDRAKFRDLIEEKVVAEILDGRCDGNETAPLFKLYCEAADEAFADKLADR